MRCYVGEVARPLHDIRIGHADLHDPDMGSWSIPQAFGRELRNNDSWGIIYRSVRNPGGECIAVLRPPAVTIPCQGPHLCYVWNGSMITSVFEKRLIL
jgi:hypothetical protein